MSWIDNLKKWFWGELKPELQEEPIERAQPKVITTTDEVLEDEDKQKAVEKKETVKKKKPRKPRKPRKTKKKETGE